MKGQSNVPLNKRTKKKNEGAPVPEQRLPQHVNTSHLLTISPVSTRVSSSCCFCTDLHFWDANIWPGNVHLNHLTTTNTFPHPISSKNSGNRNYHQVINQQQSWLVVEITPEPTALKTYEKILTGVSVHEQRISERVPMRLRIHLF